MGEAPVGFLLEAVLRIIILFAVIVFSIRIIGRRISSSLNRNDLAAISSIAAAIGVPMQDPSKGLLPAIIMAVVIVVITRLLNIGLFNNKKLERLMQGSFSALVSDGVINQRNLIKNNISKERVLAQLRSENIVNLGEVQRLYLESSGSFSLVKSPQPRPGMSVIPEWDRDFNDPSMISKLHSICKVCGWLNEHKKAAQCPVCKSKDWNIALN